MLPKYFLRQNHPVKPAAKPDFRSAVASRRARKFDKKPANPASRFFNQPLIALQISRYVNKQLHNKLTHSAIQRQFFKKLRQVAPGLLT
jgi:hypothetical protein